MKKRIAITVILFGIILFFFIIDLKLVAAIKPTSKSVPSAVPVVTQEEAEKLNDEAIEFALIQKEEKEPFIRLYQDSKIETLCFEGTIRATSTVPDPEKNDYDNCLYAIFVELDSLLSDETTGTGIACEVIVNVPIMKNKIILQDNKFLPGDKVWCTCAEYDTMPQSIQEIQISDDIQSYEHQQYFSIGIRKISSFQIGGNRSFAKREKTILPIQSLPEDKNAVSSRHNRIQKEITRIENELKKHGGSFAAWKEEYKPVAEKYDKLCRERFKGWINDSFFAAGGKETSYSTNDYIDGILPYKKYLEENNIDLIIVRIPSKWDFAARVLASDDFQENPAWVEHYYECLKKDIEIIDPMPEMWRERFNFPLFYFYNSSGELHPFEGQAIVSAKVLSAVLKRYQHKKSEQELFLTDYLFQTDQARFFWPPGNEKFDPQKNIVFKQVVRDNKTIGSLVPCSEPPAPFLFLSNSYFWYPQRSLGASVPGYTAYFIQAIPDWFYQDGIHNPMLRNLVAKPQLLNLRRAVIMVGHPDDWNGFPSIPQYIQDKAKRITLEKTLHAFSDEMTINDNCSFQISMDKNETVSFIPNDAPISQRINQFDISFKIPDIAGKKTCMIRVNFDTISYITMKCYYDQNDTVIDACSLAPGVGQYADLFVPLSNQVSDVKIVFQPKHYEKEYSIKNIELWYY